MTSERSSKGPFSSISAIWKIVGHKKMYSPYERPPFPILIDKPTVSDLLGELRFSDFFMFGTIYGFGIVWGYAASRPFPGIMQRLLVYHSLSHMFLVVAFSASLIVPFRRITGFWDNGLRWRQPEDKLKKYDTSSHFEKATGWSSFRVNNE